MEDQALAEIADQLYALPLEEFISARTAAAKEATVRSGKELAAAVKALTKPSAAAWTVNMLARSRPEVLDDLHELGGRMREAQEQFDAGALRELNKERRAALASAVDAARETAAGLGRPLSNTLATEVEATLRAMTADEGAAAAVRSSRLLRSLSADGVQQVSLDGAVAVPEALVLPNRPGSAAPEDVATARKAQAPTAKASASGQPRVPARNHTEPKKSAAELSKDGEEKPRTTDRREPPAGKAPEPRLVAVQPKQRSATPSVVDKASARAEEARHEAEEATRAAEDRAAEAAAVAEEVAHLTSEVKRLKEKLKDVEDRLDKARKREATTGAEARQLRRAADKTMRAADLARERFLRLGDTRS